MTGTAKIPNGCAENDACKSPCIKKLMECPRPQPGQNGIPRNLKRQNE